MCEGTISGLLSHDPGGNGRIRAGTELKYWIPYEQRLPFMLLKNQLSGLKGVCDRSLRFNNTEINVLSEEFQDGSPRQAAISVLLPTRLHRPASDSSYRYSLSEIHSWRGLSPRRGMKMNTEVSRLAFNEFRTAR
jgi:hypothetical protein